MERVPDLQEAMTAMEGVPMPETFQVFINHRGPDVKKTLASLIYHRLTSYGLSVFLDKDELRTGDYISLAISTAIHAASIHIVILSPGYAESTWCLEELYWILRSSHRRDTKIIPVFFDVEPTDPRYIERGCYAKAFENYRSKGRVQIEVIQKWEIALNADSHISGLLFKTKESDYGECLEKIVKVVEEVFKSAPLEVAKYSVGLHQKAEDFETEIMKQRDSKSTLARFKILRHLDLSGSCNLTELPNTFSQLLQLQYLSLRGCVSLSIPPDILGEISTLEYVDFKGCRNLLALPLGIPYQRHLRYLKIY